MDDDDKPVGRVLTRREVLALLGAAGAAALAACSPQAAALTAPAPPATTAAPVLAAATTAVTAAATASAGAPPAPTAATTVTVTPVVALPACIARPAQTEGPYFVDEKLNRSDLRADTEGGAAARTGVPLLMTFRVAQLNGADCAALAGAQVDVWHCDADGVYSDVGGAGGHNFLRGYQLTDANGAAGFTTIYPGWYPGRTAHIHFKVRTEAGLEFTSQVYFDDAVSDAVYGLTPYNARGERDTRNVNDGVYRAGGDQLLLNLTTMEEGYAAVFDLGLQLS
ncbi:MAG: intradiol ring-cleavage dioxygenase [Anaerolineales bacterium]|nr:intradiol ring-cleavage dioxygenase [Anaerolineales bacterium]